MMKKFYLTLIALLLTISAFSQAKSAYSLVVENHTNCPQTFLIVGDEFCTCGAAYSSMMITIPALTTYTYANSTFLGGSFDPFISKGLVGAKILNGPITCIPSPSGGAVGQPGCGFPMSYGFMNMQLPPNCSPCGNTKATWYPAINSCQETARLIFTP